MALRPTVMMHTGDEIWPTATQPAVRRRRTTLWPRWLRHLVVLLVLVLMAWVPLAATRPIPTWTADFHHATCVGACCVIMDGFVELSCGEYTPPAPTTAFGGSSAP
jgi:hypothetical protein